MRLVIDKPIRLLTPPVDANDNPRTAEPRLEVDVSRSELFMSGKRPVSAEPVEIGGIVDSFWNWKRLWRCDVVVTCFSIYLDNCLHPTSSAVMPVDRHPLIKRPRKINVEMMSSAL